MNDFSALMELRARNYRLLSIFYKEEISPGRLEQLRAATFPSGQGWEMIFDSIRREGHMFSQTQNSGQKRLPLLRALAADYARIFLGAGTMTARQHFLMIRLYQLQKADHAGELGTGTDNICPAAVYLSGFSDGRPHGSGAGIYGPPV